ncbi:DeoR/GlpR family DNA-binding transcription regulator [Streptacidiphilus carbonis]|uniref:DeoR/GlpR family DNA-binding transcription regulator n=1 Tax=Streptacidiphilus carbonis TaxID=105422 RepID=UPI0005AB540A|nr:DeoR/GlpR family DNA-binding transcription regulator [Streptacidiphilus carbonis]
MYAEERHQLIVEQARRDGRVDVTALAVGLDVATETVRRDLTTLERQGLLRRVHGGAIPVERLGFEPGLAQRASALTEEKERIAKAAIAELPDEGTILLDAGTTTARLAEHLPADRELTVVTNGLAIAALLATRPHINLFIVGGRVRSRTHAVVGEWTRGPLADTYVDVAFMGTNGISVQRGLTTPDTAEADVKRQMMASARRSVVLADHTKFAADHFARFGRVDEVDVVVTDSGLDSEVADELADAGPRVVRA